MVSEQMPENRGRPSAPIVVAAVALLIGSLAMFCWSVWYLTKAYAGSMSQFLLYAKAPPTAILDLLTISQVLCSLLGIVTSIGLLGLREWARKAVIFLSTVPVGGVVLGLLFFGAAGQANGAASLYAGVGILMYGVLLVILLGPSIWWFVLFRKETVRSLFQ
jgi:hypothetical protein